MSNTITRREFLKKSAAGAGLAIAVSITPMGHKIFALSPETNVSFKPNAWIQVTPDDIITITVNKSEMGQGVYTSLPMIVADELDADFAKVKFVAAPAAGTYKDPVWGMQATGGSTSIRHMFDPLQKASAAAREMLVKAASQAWQVPEEDLETHKNTVKNKKDGRVLAYGDLAQKASHLQVPSNPRLKKAGQFNLIGTPAERLDIPVKVNGEAVFGIDVQVPGALYCTVERPPSFGAKVVAYDKESAAKVQGVRSIFRISRGIAVCADTLDASWRGKKALKTKWTSGARTSMNTRSMEKEFIDHLEKEGLVARNDGDVKGALLNAAKKVTSLYLLPFLSHMNMEPMNCTAFVRENACDVWIPTQNQTGVFELARKVTGLRPEQINIHTTYLGTGFGRRFETDFAEEALEASKAAGKPVKVLWTREEDVRNDFYRPGNCCRIEGGLDDKGNLIAWNHRVVVPSIFARAMPGMVKRGIDPAAVEGIENTPYEIPNIRVEYVRLDTPVPVGFWRSVGNSHNGFTMESFMDEMAHAASKDPLEFRLGLLRNNPRPRRLLETVAEKAGWGKPPKLGQSLGIAQHFSFNSYVAHIAEVSVDKKSGTIKVHKVVCAVDCGRAINPDTIKAQMQGSIIMGMSAALKEKIEFQAGAVKTSNFSDYDLLRMSEAPDVEVHIVTSNDALGGIGEPGVPPVAPAVANAVFSAVGARLRALPMTSEAVLAAIKSA